MTTNKEDQDHGAESPFLNIIGSEQAPLQSASRNQGSRNVPTVEREVIASACADELASKFAKRRRFMKLGASTVPVALTLTSRPVFAWHCAPVSAHHSASIASNKSGKTRAENAYIDNECWTISNWCKNTSRAGLGRPWSALGTALYKTSNSSKIYWKDYKCEKVCSSFELSKLGLKPTDTVLSRLLSGTDFQKYMLVAYLNAKLIPQVKNCLQSYKTDQLPLMISGTYSPPNSNVVWHEKEIMQYLYENWIVRPA